MGRPVSSPPSKPSESKILLYYKLCLVLSNLLTSGLKQFECLTFTIVGGGGGGGAGGEEMGHHFFPTLKTK